MLEQLSKIAFGTAMTVVQKSGAKDKGDVYGFIREDGILILRDDGYLIVISVSEIASFCYKQPAT